MDAALVSGFFALMLLGAPRTEGSTRTVCELYKMGLSCPSGYILEIYSARYGRDDWTTCPHSKIKTIKCSAGGALEKVRGLCQGQQTCSVPVTNSFFGGDPCEHTYKYLRVSYGCVTRFQVTCEGSRMTLSCPAPKTIKIVTAAYGRSDRTTCPHPKILTTSCLAASSYSVVTGACQGKTSCSIPVYNSVFGGDPCEHTYKYLRVSYRCL